jgi:flagellar motor switch protein FliG
MGKNQGAIKKPQLRDFKNAEEIKDEELQEEVFQNLHPHEKAAILFSLIGNDKAKMIISHMKDSEVLAIVDEMQKISQAPVWLGKKILGEYLASLQESQNFVFDQNAQTGLARQLLGSNREAALYGTNGHTGAKPELDALELMDDTVLFNFLQQQHIQTQTVIFLHLKIKRRQAILSLFPPDLQGELVLRMAKVETIDFQNIVSLGEELKKEVGLGGQGRRGLKMGGVKEMAKMLAKMSASEQQVLLRQIDIENPEMGEELRQQLFTFNDLDRVNDRGIQEMLKQVRGAQLALALRNAPEACLKKVFKNMSQKSGKNLQEDLQRMGKQRLADVEKAQQSIVQMIKDLEQEGKAVISNGEDESYV